MSRRFLISPVFITILATALALTVVTLLSASAAPAEAVFPPGLRIGLAPPAGMVPSDEFPGFVDQIGRAHV